MRVVTKAFLRYLKRRRSLSLLQLLGIACGVALFVKHKVTMVFLGHEHLYLRTTIDGIPHVIAGGGGAPLYAKDEDGGFHHYVLVNVDGDTVSGEVVDVKGKVRDKF